MGCSESKEEKAEVRQPNYIAMALLNANRAAQMVGTYQMQGPHQLDEEQADMLIRKAKNDGQTVSVMNGCLYLDYKFQGFLPPTMS